MEERSRTAAEPAARVVLLGASNLARGLAGAVRAARGQLAGPLELLIACGHGRSYGIESNFLGRTLPGIEACGLWRALEQGGPRPTYALLVDPGNDLVYGLDAQRIEGFIAGALERLERAGAKAVLVGLPLENVRGLPAWEYELWRRLFFPTHDAPRAWLLEQAEELQERVAALARARRCAHFVPERGWYGADPIHVAARHRTKAWSTWMRGWGTGAAGELGPREWATERPWCWMELAPERRRVLGVEQRKAQPCARLRGGSVIGMY